MRFLILCYLVYNIMILCCSQFNLIILKIVVILVNNGEIIKKVNIFFDEGFFFLYIIIQLVKEFCIKFYCSKIVCINIFGGVRFNNIYLVGLVNIMIDEGVISIDIFIKDVIVILFDCNNWVDSFKFFYIISFQFVDDFS